MGDCDIRNNLTVTRTPEDNGIGYYSTILNNKTGKIFGDSRFARTMEKDVRPHALVTKLKIKKSQ